MSTKVTTSKHIDYDFDGEPFEWDGTWSILVDGKVIGACAQDKSMTYPTWGGHIVLPSGEVKKMWLSRRADFVRAAKDAWGV